MTLLQGLLRSVKDVISIECFTSVTNVLNAQVTSIEDPQKASLRRNSGDTLQRVIEARQTLGGRFADSDLRLSSALAKEPEGDTNRKPR